MAFTPKERAAISSSAVACIDSPHLVYLKKADEGDQEKDRGGDKGPEVDLADNDLSNEDGFHGEYRGRENDRIGSPDQFNEPLKKKESPTVTMMTLRTGSPTMGRRKRCSVKRPRMNPTTKRKEKGRDEGDPPVVEGEADIGPDQRQLTHGQVEDP